MTALDTRNTIFLWLVYFFWTLFLFLPDLDLLLLLECSKPLVLWAFQVDSVKFQYFGAFGKLFANIEKITYLEWLLFKIIFVTLHHRILIWSIVNQLNRMRRHIVTLICLLLLSVSMLAEDSLPVIEIKADRTIIYPQRMELMGEESLMDILHMVPDLMIAGYDNVILGYNLRIDNCPVNGDERLILSQMKAKDIAVIQVCNNTGVAKGTIGTGNVLDINMKMPSGVKGFVEGRGDFGKNVEGVGTINTLYGSKSTDLYANASYLHQDDNKDYLTLHMTNRFNDKNRLLTYFTQQFLEILSVTSRKIMGRARYFHTFNDVGTELLLVGSYQYSSDPVFSNKLPLFNAELNTPLFTKRLSMMLGVEGNYLMTKQKSRDWSWDIFDHDIYMQFTYTLPKWRFTAGNRMMFYNYKLKDGADSKNYSDTRNNANVCVAFVPDNRNQIQLGYYHKFYNPSYEILFMNTITLSDEEWAITEGRLDEWSIHQIKLSYAYSKQKLTVQTEASYYAIEGEENFAELGTSAYWKIKGLTLTGGSNYYIAKSGGYASFRFAPTISLPQKWQIGMQLVFHTEKHFIRELYGTPVYGCLSVNKPLGKHWHFGVDWHDMFDPLYSKAVVNRHAANVKLQYRF